MSYSVSLQKFQRAIEAAPLGVFQSQSQSYMAIPASIVPVILPDQLWCNLQQDAGFILSALQKVSRWLRLDAQNHLSQSLFANLSAIEREQADFGGLATARLDLFFDGDDLVVIEANTTIPAMQAYSDMVKDAYLEARLSSAGKSVPSNTQDLLHSLIQHYERTGGNKSNPRIAIIARQGDSQMAELLWMQRKWQEQGYETFLATPDQFEIKDNQVQVNTHAIDLTYRHIFAYKLDRNSAFAEACLKSETYKVFNPIAAHLEAKGVLAELSRIAADEQLSERVNLNEQERRATTARVAWSRVLREGAGISPDAEPIPDLIAWIKAHKDSLVIKSSLGYGGKGIFIGDAFDKASNQSRVREIMGTEQRVSWAEFIDFLLLQGRGQWIAQRKISGRQVPNQFLVNGKLLEGKTFVDCSIFTNSGVAHRPSGGACRFSPDPIVNIGLGGGVAPLLLESEIYKTTGASKI